MRGEGEAVALGVRLQEAQIVLDGLGGEREDGGGEAAGEEVAPLGGELADGQALGVRGQRLEAVVDALVRQVGHEASSSKRCVGCNSHCVCRSVLSSIRAKAGSMDPARVARERQSGRRTACGCRVPRRVHGHLPSLPTGPPRRRPRLRTGHRRRRVQRRLRPRRRRTPHPLGRPGRPGRLRRPPGRHHRLLRRRRHRRRPRPPPAHRRLLPHRRRPRHRRPRGRLLPRRIGRLRDVARHRALRDPRGRPDPAPHRHHRGPLRRLPRPHARPHRAQGRPPPRLLRRQLPPRTLARRRDHRRARPHGTRPRIRPRLRRRRRGGTGLGPHRPRRDPRGAPRARRPRGQTGRGRRGRPRTHRPRRHRHRRGRAAPASTSSPRSAPETPSPPDSSPPPSADSTSPHD